MPVSGIGSRSEYLTKMNQTILLALAAIKLSFFTGRRRATRLPKTYSIVVSRHTKRTKRSARCQPTRAEKQKGVAWLLC
jgi:hypothetical protein